MAGKAFFGRSLATLAIGVLALLVGPAACGSSKGSGGGPPKGSGGSSGSGGTDGGGGVGATGAGLCLLNNCNSDAECEGCSFGRTKCNLDENRCVACDPVAGTGCKAGEECTSFGTCAPVGLTCPTDASGTPTVTCSADSDCIACDPMHQKCDTATSKCVACIPSGDTSACLGSDYCTPTGACEQKCPPSCTQDADCGNCVNGGKEAKACNNHVCAECSETLPCGAGLECQKGVCVKPCGKAGSPIEGGGECQTAAECYGCGNTESTTTWECKFPINGGTHGTCVPPAEGCTDIAKSGVVLPPPFDQVTNLCSSDSNCANVSIDLNVGKLIKDLVGSDEIDLGLKKIKINDATISYKMPQCASIEIKDESCGVCVPCETDADCKPIPLDPLISDLFAGDALAQLAAAFLMDLLFGKDKEHEIHMQCQPVAKGYGVCAPCANPTKACGTGSTGQPGSGTCDHNVCETGSALDPTCGLCAAAVCLNDFYCCTVEWDDMCKQHVDDVCAVGCDGTTTCTHGPCETGGSMHKSCSPCVEEVCKTDPYCCNLTSGQWDQLCVDSAQAKPECTQECSGSSSCVHTPCEVGSKLEDGCSACVTNVCDKDPFCCSTEWDKFCVLWAKQQQVQAICNCPP